MTCRRIHLVTLALSLAVAATAGLAVKPALAVPKKPSVVAVINVQQTFEGLDEKSEIESNRERQLRKIREEYDKRKGELNRLTEELGVLEANSPIRQEKEDEIILKSAQLDAWLKLEERRLSRTVATRLENVRRKMVDTIANVSKAQDPPIDLVLNRETTINLPTSRPGQGATINIRKVLYAIEGADITQNVIQRMNNEFRNRPENK